MPVKRRRAKGRRRDLPETLQRLLAGEAIEMTEANRELLVGIVYVRDYREDLSDEDWHLAGELLRRWVP
jgi:hypothetical protein